VSVEVDFWEFVFGVVITIVVVLIFWFVYDFVEW